MIVLVIALSFVLFHSIVPIPPIYGILPGSGSWLLLEAHKFWLGHPAQASALPAFSLCTPGQSISRWNDISIHNKITLV